MSALRTHRLRRGLEDLWPGRSQGPCAGRRRSCHRARRIRRHHGAVRLRQVDGDEHHRLPRHADDRARYSFLGIDAGRLDRDRRAVLRNLYIGFVFQGYNLLPRTTAAENVELPLIYRGIAARERRAPRHAGAGRRSALTAASITRRPNFPAASSSAWRSRAPSSPGRRCSSPTSRPATSTPPAATRSWNLLTQSEHELGLTIVMVTHEADVAGYAARIIRFLDGHVASDTLKRGWLT